MDRLEEQLVYNGLPKNAWNKFADEYAEGLFEKRKKTKLLPYALLSIALAAPSQIQAPEKNLEYEIATSTTVEKQIPLPSREERKDNLFLNYNLEDLEQRINTKQIPVLMFHEIGKPENRYRVSPSNFRGILDDLRHDNYFLVTLEEFKKGDFSRVPVGRKPLLLTFDDASKGQFEYIPGTREIDPNSAIGILEDYKAKHPDFGSGAVFFISYSEDDHKFRKPFVQDGKAQDKLEFLLENEYDIGWHAPYHNNNTNATRQDIANQVFKLNAFLYYNTKGRIEEQSVKSYAHPFGAVPRNYDAMNELKENFDLIFNAWGGKSKHPLSENFDVSSIPRIEMHTNNTNLVLGKQNAYKVESGDRFFYKALNEDIYPHIEKIPVHSAKPE